MIGWTEKINDELIELRMREYERHQKNKNNKSQKSKVLFFNLKTQPYVLIIAIFFVLLSLIETILICIAFIGTKKIEYNDDFSSAGYLWNIFKEMTEIKFNLSSYGTVVIFISILLIVVLIYFAFSWIKDNYVSSLTNKSKKNWFALLFSSTFFYVVFLVLILVGTNIVGKFPKNIGELKNNNFINFGISFKILPRTNMDNTITIIATPFSIFISVMQIICCISSFFWLIIFNLNVNYNKFNKSKKN